MQRENNKLLNATIVSTWNHKNSICLVFGKIKGVVILSLDICRINVLISLINCF